MTTSTNNSVIERLGYAVISVVALGTVLSLVIWMTVAATRIMELSSYQAGLSADEAWSSAAY